MLDDEKQTPSLKTSPQHFPTKFSWKSLDPATLWMTLWTSASPGQHHWVIPGPTQTSVTVPWPLPSRRSKNHGQSKAGHSPGLGDPGSAFPLSDADPLVPLQVLPYCKVHGFERFLQQSLPPHCLSIRNLHLSFLEESQDQQITKATLRGQNK